MQSNKLKLLETLIEKGDKGKISLLINELRNGPPVGGLISMLAAFYDKSDDADSQEYYSGIHERHEES